MVGKLSMNLTGHSKEKTIVLITSLAVRLVIGLIFFGSIDTMNSIGCSLTIFSGHIVTDIPYFPVVPVFIWLGGIFNVISPLPLTLCYKIIPILFDCLLTLLIYDIVSKRSPDSAFKAALLYALSPVAIIVNCLHGQWDSIFIFFVVFAFYVRDFYGNSKKKFFLFGVLFGFSFMVKPISLMLFPLFIEPWINLKKSDLKKYLINQLFSIFGLLAIVTACFGLFILFGYDLKEMLQRILSYSNSGVQILGLPFAYPFSQFAFLKQRFWIVGVLILASSFYYLRTIESFEIILFSLAFSIGVSGLSPQYLIWLIPLLLIMKHYRFSALYSFVVTLFYLIYYISPFASCTKWENMTTFAALKGFGWLMPPSVLSGKGLLPVIHLLGNYIVPFIALFIALYLLTRAIIALWKPEKYDVYQKIKRSRLVIFKDNYILFNIILWTLIAIIFLASRGMHMFDNLTDAYNSKLTWYNLKRLDAVYYTGTYGSISFINITFILFLLSAWWSLKAYSMSIVGKVKEVK